MTLVDIKNAIVDQIKANINGANVPADDTPHGFKKPAYIVEIVPAIKSNVSPSLFDRDLTVIIHGFSLSNTNSELLQMQDQLETAFDLTLTVSDRVLTIEQTDAQIVDKVLNFSLDLSYTDSRDEETGEFMENLNLKEGY